MKTNIKQKNNNPLEELKRSVMSCLLWEDEFYEDGESISQRIQNLINNITDLDKIVRIIYQAKDDMKLRHIPLYMACCLLNKQTKHINCNPNKEKINFGTLFESLITRPDDMGEIISIFKKLNPDCKTIPNSIKKAINNSFCKFDEYQLAKWNKLNVNYKLVDIINLCHPKNTDLIKKIVYNNLKTPETWEVLLSAAGSNKEKKKEAWLKLINDNRLPDMAFLMNIRNISNCGVSKDIIRQRIQEINSDKLLPINLVRSGLINVDFTNEIEQVFFKLFKQQKNKEETIILVDVSASMDGDRLKYASALAMIGREKYYNCSVYTFSTQEVKIKNIHGFGLFEAIDNSQNHSITCLNNSLKNINKKEDYKRIIIITDEQATELDIPQAITDKSYIINVASYQKGVGYTKGYKHINGFSDKVFDYIDNIEDDFDF